MNCKLVINLNEGTLDVEGSEEFVKEIYKDFKDIIINHASSKADPVKVTSKSDTEILEPQTKPKAAVSKNKAKQSAVKTKSSSNEMKFLNDLNLRPKDEVSLKGYFAQFNLKSSEELTLLIIYYLKEILKIDKITISHIFTSFKELGKKIPTHLKQVLINNKNNKNWIDVNDWDDLKFTISGMNHMEHDMTKAVESGK